MALFDWGSNMQYVLNRNAQPNGDYEIHNGTKGCNWMPSKDNQIDLGSFPSCIEAVVYAKTTYDNHQINGCKFCCEPCHTS